MTVEILVSVGIEHPRQERLRALFPGLADHLSRRPFLDDDAAVHEQHLVGHLARELHLVRDDDHRHAFLGEAAHDAEDVADELGVQRGRRLVEQHQLRLHRQRPRDRHPLLLPAGQLTRVALRLVAESHALQEFHRALPHLGLRLAADLDRRLHDVFQRRHVREQVEALEHHADVLALEGDFLLPQLVQLVATLPVPDEHAVDVQPPGVDLLEVVDAAQQRRLARAGRPDQAEHLALLHLEVDAVEHPQAAEALADLLRGNDRGHLRFPPPEPNRNPSIRLAHLVLVATLRDVPREKYFSM